MMEELNLAKSLFKSFLLLGMAIVMIVETGLYLSLGCQTWQQCVAMLSLVLTAILTSTLLIIGAVMVVLMEFPEEKLLEF